MLAAWTSLLLAFGGGAFGAAIGGLAAFIFVGVLVLFGVGIASSGGGRDALTHIAFGGVFGPHVFFAGGAAAVGYAFRRGYVSSGRDLAHLLMGLNKPDVLAIGGLFGALGWLANDLLLRAGCGTWTDTIALTVLLSGIAARFAFGRTGLLGKAPNPGGHRFRPDERAHWLPWQQDAPQLIAIGLAVGLLSAHMARVLGIDKGGDVLGFGFAAAVLILLQMGFRAPVTHHIALPAALALLLSSSLLIGALVGILSALLGEFFSRLFLIHGDTYIDPPAAAIAGMTTVLRLADAAGLFKYAVLP